MKTRLIWIGSSQGARTPKSLLDQAVWDEVKIEAEGDRLITRAFSHPRADWDESFQAMSLQGDDAYLGDVELLPTQWNEEWEW